MGNTLSGCTEASVTWKKEEKKKKSTAFLTIEVLLTLFHFSGVLFSTLLLPATSDSGCPVGQYKQMGRCYSAHSSLFCLFGFFCCFTGIKMRTVPKALPVSNSPCHPVNLSTRYSLRVFYQADPELWQPRRYSQCSVLTQVQGAWRSLMCPQNAWMQRPSREQRKRKQLPQNHMRYYYDQIHIHTYINKKTKIIL